MRRFRDSGHDHANHFEPSAVGSDLRQLSARGATLNLIAQVVSVLVGVVATMILARLLSPADFGLVAMVSPITGFLMIFVDAGLSTATIQQRVIDQHQVSGLFWINLALGTLLSCLTLVIAPLVGLFYGDPRVPAIAAALAVTFIFAGLAAQHQALLRRQMRFGRLAIITAASHASSAIVGISAGLAGMSYWSLVMMAASFPAFQVVLSWTFCSWRPDRPARTTGMRSMVAFGGWLTGFNIVNHLGRNADDVLIGRFIGAGPLGLYSKAYALLKLPILLVRDPVTRVAVPALSRLQDDPSRYRGYLRQAISTVVFLSAPLIGICWMTADDIIGLILGQQWLAAVPVFRVLALAALVQSVNVVTGWVYISLGQTRRWFRWALVSSSVTVLSFAVGLPWGIQGVAISYTIANYVILIPSLLYCLQNAPVSLRDIGEVTWCPVASSLFSVGVVTVTLGTMEAQGRIAVVLLEVVMFAALYIGAMTVLPDGRRTLADVMLVLREMGWRQHE